MRRVLFRAGEAVALALVCVLLARTSIDRGGEVAATWGAVIAGLAAIFVAINPRLERREGGILDRSTDRRARRARG